MKINSKSLLYVPAVVNILLIAFIIISCQKTNKTCKEPVNTQVTSVDTLHISDSLNNIYNYTKNKGSFDITFLEFGAVGCIECKKMEKVLQEVKTNYKSKVNVVFYNARIKENKKIFKHFGIQLIPVQVLLDNNGKEFFRHVGYYSYKELKIEFDTKLSKSNH